MTPPFTVTNAEGVAAVHEARRTRKWQRDQGRCCSDGSCETCCGEAEALKEARDE